jgi:hypothetical protein
MSEVRLLIREADRCWSGTVHASVADMAVAALSADPITLAELEAACGRYARRTEGQRFLPLHPGDSAEPWDAGADQVESITTPPPVFRTTTAEVRPTSSFPTTWPTSGSSRPTPWTGRHWPSSGGGNCRPPWMSAPCCMAGRFWSSSRASPSPPSSVRPQMTWMTPSRTFTRPGCSPRMPTWPACRRARPCWPSAGTSRWTCRTRATSTTSPSRIGRPSSGTGKSSIATGNRRVGTTAHDVVVGGSPPGSPRRRTPAAQEQPFRAESVWATQATASRRGLNHGIRVSGIRG